MTFKNNMFMKSILLALMLFLVTSCNPETPQNPPETDSSDSATTFVDELALTLTPTPEPDTAVSPTSTPTPTPKPVVQVTMTNTPITSRCADLSGAIEVQVLVGPAEVVGLEPVAVGEIPFQVVSSTPPYNINGEGAISYEAVLEEEWGTYAVTLNMTTGVEGDCTGALDEERLLLTVKMNGEQMVVVDAEGFHGEYPWQGEQAFPVEFPLQDGATAGGEGWTFVLHLGRR